MNAEVWVNGTRLGFHPYGFTPFAYDLTPYLRAGTGNRLAVRVDNSPQPNCRWYGGSGIYRHVRLEVLDPLHLEPGGVVVSTAGANAEEAALRVEATVRNDSGAAQLASVDCAIKDDRAVVAGCLLKPGLIPGEPASAAMIPAGETATFRAVIRLPRPRLWSPDSPALYGLTVRALAGARVADQDQITFGVRTLRVSAANGLELNGRPLKLSGGSVHHDNGPLGAAALDRAEERRVEQLKTAGFNAVRTAHNPPSPAFLGACDRLGLLVMDEAFDGWEKSKSPHDYGVVFADWWRRDIDAWVRRDRNHPSVVFWSIGNEVYERGNADGARIAHLLADRIRELDPTRPVTAGINGLGGKNNWSQLDPLFAALDVAGYNYQLGRVEEDHARLPSRVIVATESYSVAVIEGWSAASRHPYVIGDFVWSALDYLGEAGIGRVFPPGQTATAHWEAPQYPWHGAACGDIDLTGWRRPISHYRNIVWNRGETLYMAVVAPAPGGGAWSLSRWSAPPAQPSWTWPGSEGRPLSVEVYSQRPRVRLYLNGRLLGEKPATRAEEYKAVFAVPYEPGALQAVGDGDGKPAETFSFSTAGPAAAVRLSADRAAILADGSDLSFVTVEVVDRNGILRPDASLPLSFAVEGAGAIAGIANADMTDSESYQGPAHRTFQGRALVVIRSARHPGAIVLSATALGFPPAQLRLDAVPLPVSPP